MWCYSLLPMLQDCTWLPRNEKQLLWHKCVKLLNYIDDVADLVLCGRNTKNYEKQDQRSISPGS